MINNVLYLKNACFHLIHPEMCSSLRELLLNLINNCHAADQPSSSIQLRHKLNIDDSRISELFSGTIQFYSTALVGQARFATSCYYRRKNADDSSVVYQIDNEVRIGCIHQMFTVDG